MRPKLTIKDIAKELGVSVSTVSKALKDSHEISVDTRERIKAFAKFHNYKPNSLALKLRQNKSKVIGVVIPEISNHFFSNVLRGVEKEANELGFNVMFCHSDESYEKELQSIEMLMDGSVDGIIISTSIVTHQKKAYQHINKMLSEGFPVVLFDRMLEGVECDQVVIDDEGGAFKATEYLIETGCKRIGILTIPSYVKMGELRKKGYLKALEKHRLPIDENLIVEVDESKDIEEQIRVLFRTKDMFPDAILAVNGEINAKTAMIIAQEHGLKVPEDMSVITFTDGLIARYSSPSITTVLQHGFEMGKQAAEILINRIMSKSAHVPFQQKVISTTLKVRKSTK